MGSRTTAVLALLVLCLGAYIFLVDRKGPSTDERRGNARRALRFAVEDVDRVNVLAGSLEVCAQRTGSTWRLTVPVQARADGDAVLALLDELAGLDHAGVVTAAERRERKIGAREYGLDIPRARIRLGIAGRELEILIGRDTPVGGELYLQQVGREDVLLASTNLLAALPASAIAWRDRRLLEGEPSSVVRAEARRSDGYLLLSRGEREWRIQKPVTARADAAAVDAWLQRLHELRVLDFVADSDVAAALYGLDEPQAQLTLVARQGGRESTLVIGREIAASPGQVYAAQREGNHVFAVSNSVLEILRTPLERIRDRRVLPWEPPLLRRVEIEKGPERVVLVSTNGSDWEIAGTPKLPADAQTVMRLIGAWTGPRILDFVDDTQTNLSAYGFDRPAATLLFSTTEAATTNLPAPGESIRLLMGRTGATGSVYVAPLGEAVAWRVPETLLAVSGARSLDYRVRQPLALEPAEVRSVEWSAAGQVRTWERSGTNGENWVATPGTQQVLRADVDEWLREAVSVRVAEWVVDSPADLAPFGLAAPSATITIGLTGASGLAKVILLGGKAGEGRIYGLIKGQDTVFVLDEAGRDKLLVPLYKTGQPDATEHVRGEPPAQR
jgi:hypothetical protein